jgi:hypothetical protein
MRYAYKILAGKPEWKRPLIRPRHRWDDYIKMDLRDIWLEGVNWIHLAQHRDQWQALVKTILNLWMPQKVGNFLISWVYY